MQWTTKDARRSRKSTCALIDAADSGLLSWEDIARNCMMYMSEADVTDMARTYDMLPDVIEEEEDEEEDDD